MSTIYPYSRILYKTDDTPGWFKGAMGGTEEECEKECKKLQEEGKLFKYEVWGGGSYCHDIPHYLQEYSESAHDLHMVTDLIYNTGDGRYYFPKEKMPYPDKCSPRSTSKFKIDVKVEPEEDEDAGIMGDLEDEYDFEGNTTAMLYFGSKAKICIETEPVLEDIPKFLKRLKKEGYANLIIDEFWYSKFLAWQKGNKIHFIIQSYDSDVVEIILNKLVNEELFISEFKKMAKKLKKGIKYKEKLHQIFKKEEDFLKTLPWRFDDKTYSHLCDTLCLGNMQTKSPQLKKFIKKVKEKSTIHSVSFSQDEDGKIDWEKDFCMRQGDYYYKIVSGSLIRYYNLDRDEKELRRYLNLYTVPDKENKTLSDLYSEVISNHCREAIECHLGKKHAYIYEDGGIEGPSLTAEQIRNLKATIQQIVTEANRNKFSVDEFAALLRKHDVDAPSWFSTRVMCIKTDVSDNKKIGE